MTCIAAYLKDGKAAISGDGRLSDGYLIHSDSDEKIHRIGEGKNEFLVGYTGSAGFNVCCGTVDLLRELESKKKYKDLEDLFSQYCKKMNADSETMPWPVDLLTVTRDHIYVIYGNRWKWMRVDKDYWSVGCGREVAMGAMELMANVYNETDASVITFNAVEVASKIQQGVGGTIRTLKLGDSGDLKKVKSKKGK